MSQIVEELEDRLGDRMDDILSVVRASLANPPPPTGAAAATATSKSPTQIVVEEEQSWDDNDIENMFDPSEVLFDDTGEGAGVEGDLDMEDD
jgi:hypothetical protein